MKDKNDETIDTFSCAQYEGWCVVPFCAYVFNVIRETLSFDIQVHKFYVENKNKRGRKIAVPASE